MTLQIIIHDLARSDVIDAAYYISDDSPAAANRFADAVDDAFARLAEMPGSGVSRGYNSPKLVGMRMWPIPGFRNHLVFYCVDGSELHILRLVHGARDIESLFVPDSNK